MDDRTKLEIIADHFVENYLRKNPVMVYSLDTYLEEWVANHRKELEATSNLTLNELLGQHLRIRSDDKEIDNEILNAAEKVLARSDSYVDTEMPDTTLIAYVESIDDLLFYQLTHLVLKSSKVRIKSMHELEEAKLEDPILPNKWIYHMFLMSMKCSKMKMIWTKAVGSKIVCPLTNLKMQTPRN